MKNIKYLLPAILLLLHLAACKKESQDTVIPVPDPIKEQPGNEPEMTYIDLTGKSLSRDQFVSLDVDGDKKLDLYFYTQDVSDNIYKLIKSQFIGGAYIYAKLNFDSDAAGEDILPALAKGKDIKSNTTNDTWYGPGEAVMMQHTHNTTNDTFYWVGNWAGKGKLYLPFRIFVPAGGGKMKYGWVEMEASTIEQKLIFYRAAICKEADVSVKAGL